MKPKVYIDGQSGTTGLQIRQRLSQRSDIELLLIEEEKRRDVEARRQRMNEADLVFLCLPDAAAIEAVELIEDPNTKIIDASTAHRCADPQWAYGFSRAGRSLPERDPHQSRASPIRAVTRPDSSPSSIRSSSQGILTPDANDHRVFAHRLLRRRQADDPRSYEAGARRSAAESAPAVCAWR